VRLVTVSDWAGHVAFCVRHWSVADDGWSVEELLQMDREDGASSRDSAEKFWIE
jgi:hypothetical protein